MIPRSCTLGQDDLELLTYHVHQKLSRLTKSVMNVYPGYHHLNGF